jgi:hypothetical protein
MGKIDASQGKLTLEDLAQRCLSSIASQAPDTGSLKTSIINRLLTELPNGKNC